MPKDRLKQLKVLGKESCFSFPFHQIEVLSRIMLLTDETGLLKGFLFGRSRIGVSLLKFIDDTIFFSRARMTDLQNLKLILLIFGHVSYLQIWTLYLLST